MEPEDHLEREDHLEVKACLEWRDLREHQVLMDQQDLQAHWDLLDLQVTEVYLVCQVPLDLLVLGANKVLRGREETLGSLERKVHWVHLECRDPRDRLELEDREARKVHLGSREHLVLGAALVTRDPLELQG